MLPVGDREVLVLVMTYRSILSEREKISLKQCLSVLKDYPIHIVKPESTDISSWDIDFNKVGKEEFRDSCFKDIGAYSRLLLSLEFYNRFRAYKYILIYQLDAFVFRDELREWCQAGFDYIGALWFESFSDNDANAPVIKGGNGGLSLRNVKAHLKVLHSFSYISPPRQNWRSRVKDRPPDKGLMQQAAGLFLDLTIRNNTHWAFNSFRGFEDQFWCLVAGKNFPWFNIADGSVAKKFAFEMQPRRVFEMNNRKLPFGCHAWWKYDLEFWKPFIEQYGYKVNA